MKRTLAATVALLLPLAAHGQQFVEGKVTAVWSGELCTTFFSDAYDTATGARVKSWAFAVPMDPRADPTGALKLGSTYHFGEGIVPSGVVLSAYGRHEEMRFMLNIPGAPNQLFCAAPISNPPQPLSECPGTVSNGVCYQFLPRAFNPQVGDGR